MNIYRSLVRPLLFQFDPEWIHVRTLLAARAVSAFAPGRKALESLYGFEDPRLNVRLAGLCFPNPVGLPGGFDKNGVAVEALSTVGFGFQDVGSVSLHPSAGNPERPRLFRLPLDEGIRIYYGVPNDGAEAVSRRLMRTKISAPLGINLVETNTGTMAPALDVIEEIVQSYERFQGLADYIVINTNCPNSTGGVSVFQDPENLRRLLDGFRRYGSLPPMFLKMSVPLDAARIDEMLRASEDFDFVKGFVPNTSKGPPQAMKTPRAVFDRMRGSMTGPHTRENADETMRFWYSRIDPARFALVSAGGIFSAEDAYRRIRLGASLVELYTALVYRGPGLVKEIKQGLCELLARDGLSSIQDAIGADVPRRTTNPASAPVAEFA
jgi:dihydroorotate dehydrogenase